MRRRASFVHPELARGLLLVDSPLLGGWKAHALGAMKRTQLVGSLSPGAVSRKRKNAWDSKEEALEHFRHKKAFARWEPQVLQDYVANCTHDEGGRRVLSFDRAVEPAIYNTLPDNLDRLLRRHPLQCKAAFIGGLQSQEMQQVGMAFTGRIVEGRITMLEGSHLFPMERPIAAAAAIEAALLALE
jgi:pimeloyl-ACP methyl ester carboxylesterase